MGNSNAKCKCTGEDITEKKNIIKEQEKTIRTLETSVNEFNNQLDDLKEELQCTPTQKSIPTPNLSHEKILSKITEYRSPSRKKILTPEEKPPYKYRRTRNTFGSGNSRATKKKR